MCGFCSQSFNESEYRDHVASCSNNETYSSDQSLKNTDTKYSHSKRNNSSYSSQVTLFSSEHFYFYKNK
jgi:FPC/CPF motif-containing protein YcgG